MRRFNRIFSVLTVFLFVFSSGSLPVHATDSENNIRGIEKSEKTPLDPALALASSILYFPRQILNATLWSMGKSSATMSDPDFIEAVEDILYLYERDLAWFPMVSYSSGFRPQYGGGLYYSNGTWKSLFRGLVHDANEWSMSWKGSYTQAIDKVLWKTYVKGVYEKEDDLRYYGIGSDPEDDQRNRFIALSDQDYGVFSQDRRKLEWGTQIQEPTKKWQFRYMGFYERKAFDDTGRGDNPLRDVFDLETVPGFTNQAPVTHIYNELSAAWDTRDHKKMISRGWRAEAYVGISNGLDQNKADLVRTGGDLAAFIPILEEDRVLVPRVVMDMVSDLGDDTIPFTEYPTHATFRGISKRDLIHNDRVSVSPSLEYQWPLSHMFSAHVFTDYLAAGPSVGSIEWSEGLWAFGGGIDFHYANREFARFQMAGGSEGFQAKITIGVPIQKNTRSG